MRPNQVDDVQRQIAQSANHLSHRVVGLLQLNQLCGFGVERNSGLLRARLLHLGQQILIRALITRGLGHVLPHLCAEAGKRLGESKSVHEGSRGHLRNGNRVSSSSGGPKLAAAIWSGAMPVTAIVAAASEA